MTQDTEFEKWMEGFKEAPTYHIILEEAFRAGRMAQREKDAQCCIDLDGDFAEEYALAIREQEI